jgi:hypothetical protein
MTTHELERRRYVQAKPRNNVPVLVAYHGKFPEVIRGKERHHKNDDIRVGGNFGY